MFLILFLVWALPLTAYQYQIAACLIFQNEAKYLKEWIEYHKLVGVEHFYLIDNASSDDFMQTLLPYIKSGEVELFHDVRVTETQKKYNDVQCENYEKILKLAAGKVHWLAIIDADEFIVPLKTMKLKSILKNYEDYGGLYVNWLEFGTSHVEKIPPNRLMVEMLTRCAESPRSLGKSIVRPERVSHCTDPHRMWYHPPYDHVNSNFLSFKWDAPIAQDTILIHHYMTRDLDHLIHVKFPRRQKWRKSKEMLDIFAYIDSLESKNASENTTMRRFVPLLRILIQESDRAL